MIGGRVDVRLRPLRVEVATPGAVAAAAPARPERGAERVRRLFERRPGVDHWAEDYAARLAERCPPGGSVLIQTSMSPSGPFHVGNFRDTATAHLVARAARHLGVPARILLSFDDFDAFSPRKSAGDPELAPYASRPMADAAARSAAVCRDYIAELKAVGICPPEADDDGRTPESSPWQTHYQAERYRAGRYLALQREMAGDRRRLARLLGARDPDRLFTPYCAQCGRNTTTVAALSSRSVRYRCDACGAVVRTRDLRDVKPAWAVDWLLRVRYEGIDCEPAGHDHCVAGSTMDRTQPVFAAGYAAGRPQPVIVPYGLVRQFRDAGKISGSRGGGLRVGDLLAVLPPRVVLWLYARPDVRDDIRLALDLPAMARWLDEYDRFCAAAARGDRRAAALWRLLADGPPPAGSPPPFRRVAGAVQSHLFDLPAAARSLGSAGERDDVRERLVLARTWLATWGRDRCWLPPAPLARPAGEVDPRMLDPDRLGERFPPAAYHAAAWALWGTPTAPPLSRAVALLGAAAVSSALAAFAAYGSRPLRAEVERRLADRDDGAPGLAGKGSGWG